MIRAIKQFIYGILSPIAPVVLYLLGAYAVYISIFKRAEFGLYVTCFLISLPTIWYSFHSYPLGKDIMDILFFSVLAGIYINKSGISRSENSRLIYLFIIFSYFSLWNVSLRYGLANPISTSNPLIFDFKNYIEMILLYILVFNAVKEEDHQKILVVIIALVIFVIGFKSLRNFNAGSSFSYDKRAQGPFWVVGLGANHLGAFIADYSALLMGLFLYEVNKWRKRLYLAAILVGLHPLFFAYSRGAYLAYIAVLIFYGATKKRALAFLLFPLIFFWDAILPESVVERVSMTSGSHGQLESSAAHRLILWDHALEAFYSSPLFGIGFNGFPFSLPKTETLSDTHNYYLKILSEQGLIGITLFSLILISAFYSGYKLFSNSKIDFHKGLGLGFMATTLSMAITNIFGDRFSYAALGSFFWIIWGLVDRSIFMSSKQLDDNSNQTDINKNYEKPDSI